MRDIPASIHTKHWNTKQGEVKCLADGEVHIRCLLCQFPKITQGTGELTEERGVVTAPVTGPFATTGEGGSANDERSFVGYDLAFALALMNSDGKLRR